jgi:ABC-2 type transport system permease protein
MKTIPLTIANLKSFIRNWKSILLLIIFPFLLILIIFASFNPNGLNKIPLGIIVSNTNDFNLDDYKDTYFSYLTINYFISLDDCLIDLKKYNQYACLDIIANNNTITINTYYDNTQEPIIWEIIERLKNTFEILQKQKSKQMADSLINQFQNINEKIEIFKINLNESKNDIDKYILESENIEKELKIIRNNLDSTIILLENDINEIETLKNELIIKKNNYYSIYQNNLFRIDDYANSFRNASYEQNLLLNDILNSKNNLMKNINDFNKEIDFYTNDVDKKIKDYKRVNIQAKNYIIEIENGIFKLNKIQQDLHIYKQKIIQSQNEIEEIIDLFKQINNIDTNVIINPINIFNIPTYIPKSNLNNLDNQLTEEENISNIIKGFNLISMQTMFPTIFFLLVLFLSLLISSFICLQDINSPSYTRIKKIKNIFIANLFSNYISSFIILLLPIICVLLLGHFLFKLQILNNFIIIFLLTFLLTSFFIFLGISLSNLIKDKSTTLLVTTFLLVFLMFISGFLYPIERMSIIISYIAQLMPSKIALDVFNKVVFYNQEFVFILRELSILLIWLLLIVGISIIIKKIRN